MSLKADGWLPMRLLLQHSRNVGSPLDGQIKLKTCQRLAVRSVLFLKNVDTANLFMFTVEVVFPLLPTVIYIWINVAHGSISS